MTESKRIVKTAGKPKQKQKKKEPMEEVSLEAQERLAEILNDSPRLVSLNGTEWEVRALRMGTQYLIAQEVIKINKVENASYGDVVKQFSINTPSVLKILTLVLLNDKDKIFKNGDEKAGFSDLYNATYSTLEWECNISDFGGIFLESLQLLDVGFFLESCRIVEMFRTATTARKMTIQEQK